MHLKEIQRFSGVIGRSSGVSSEAGSPARGKERYSVLELWVVLQRGHRDSKRSYGSSALELLLRVVGI